MAKFACRQCGSVFSQWTGQCRHCQAWDSLEEQMELKKGHAAAGWEKLLKSQVVTTVDRLRSGVEEFDRVCGGGIPPGAVVLVGGDPGIGKSTLLLQALAGLSQQASAAYLSGEESLDQIRARAHRLGVQHAPVALAASSNLEDVMNLLQLGTPQVMVVDSIQTLRLASADSLPGSVTQIRTCAHALIEWAKAHKVILFLVSHVTKEGVIAGPKVLEHMVDTVLYFEGERGYPFRLLRTIKNRYGAVDEIGVFSMGEQGLREIPNPSGMFLSHLSSAVPGSCILAGVEGTRPLLVEVQALVSPSFLASPRRSVVGWDQNRLAMVLAILETRCRLALSSKDVFFNVVGGVRMTETAVDVAAAAAIISCMKKKAIPRHCALFGEMGLAGEIRPVMRADARVRECRKMGLTCLVRPRETDERDDEDEQTVPLTHVTDVLKWIESLDNGPI